MRVTRHVSTRYAAFMLAWLLILVSPAFAGGASENGSEASERSRAETGEEVAEDAAPPSVYPMTITDARGTEVTVTSAGRVISLGAGVTETVAALGRADVLVAVDQSSSYPAEALEGLPRTGYVRTISAEGVLGLGPDLVLASVDVGPPEVIEQIESAGVPVLVVPEEDTVDGTIARIDFVAQALDAQDAATELAEAIGARQEELAAMLSGIDDADRARVLFIYARGAGTVMVSGHSTSANSMISLAGGVNALDAFPGYRPITAEAVISADPDVLLFMTSGLAGLGGVPGLESIPGLAQTRAYSEGRIVDFDDIYLLGFGPRVGDAALELAQELYPDRVADAN